MKLTPLGRFLVYTLLVLGAVAFLTPLAWMLSTALKPIEQTMTLPPTWTPYRLEAKMNGIWVAVHRMESYESPHGVVKDSLSGRQRVVSQASAGESGLPPAIPAGPKNPWVRVIPENGRSPEGEFVPESSLRKIPAPRWDNFKKAVEAMRHFPMYLKNTLILCFLTVIGTVISSALAAYGFSRISWKGRNSVFVLAMATMMIPFPVIMVPLYGLFRDLGWIGTLKPLWVGSFFAGAFNVFLLRQFFLGIPKDLSEAARIDGCSEFRIFWQIILPLCRPALTVVALFQFMHTWNDFLGPLIYLTNQQDYTLALGLQFFQSQAGGTLWNYLMAASTLIVLPIVILFFFAQKTFIEGISMTGIKG